MVGDLNADIRKTLNSQHEISRDFGIMRFCANTSSSSFNLDDSVVHDLMNRPCKTSSNDTCHDGIYRPLIESDRTAYSSLGSLWPLVRDFLQENIWKILADHKGVFFKISGTYSSRNSPTKPFTPTIEIEDEDVDSSTEYVSDLSDEDISNSLNECNLDESYKIIYSNDVYLVGECKVGFK